jgi:hypothetical protein
MLMFAVALLTPLMVQEAPRVAESEDKKICRRMMFTGSIFSKRICMTRQQWIEQDARTSAATEQALEHRPVMKTPDRD